jgi:hypothetical protein
MRSNAGMANRHGTSTSASRKSLPPVNTSAWPQSISRKEYFVRHIKTKQPANTSAGKRHQTAQPQCLVDRGTPLPSRASSSSFWPGISTSHDPWRFTVAPSHASHSCHLSVPYTPPRARTKVIPQHGTQAETRPTHYNQTTTQHLLYVCKTLTNIIYVCYCGFHCYKPTVSHNRNKVPNIIQDLNAMQLILEYIWLGNILIIM